MHLRLRIALLLALLLLVSTTFPVFAQSEIPGGLQVTIIERARFRAGPGVEWNIFGALEPGTPLNVDGQAPGGGWVRGIAPSGQIGWVVQTAINASADQVAALPRVWVDAPFTLPAPGGAAAPAGAAPAAPADPAAAPTPPPAAPPPPVVNAAPPSRGFALGGHMAGFDQRAIDYMRQAGMTWIKKQVRHSPGKNPSDVSALINEARGYGFRILLGVVGANKDYLSQPGYFEDYAAFVAGLAAQGVDAIEIWNEPNIDREWPSGQISPQRYTELLAMSYNAIKAANPGTIVISGAPAPTGFFGGCSGVGCDDNLFVQQMAAAGAANYMDCVGIHYNEGILPPTATSGDPRGSSNHYSRYYPAMVNVYWNAFGGRRPLCFTELGYLSPEGFPPLPGSFGWAENVTVAQQAAWLDQVVSIAARSGRVRIMILWNVNFTNYDADPMAGFAIIRPDGSCPACAALGS